MESRPARPNSLGEGSQEDASSHTWRNLIPNAGVMHAAGWGLYASIVILYAVYSWLTLSLAGDDSGARVTVGVTFLLVVLGGPLLALLFWLVARMVLGSLSALSGLLFAACFSAAIALYVTVDSKAGTGEKLAILAIFSATGILIGGGLWSLLRKRGAMPLLCLLGGLALLAVEISWLLDPGDTAQQRTAFATNTGREVSAIALPNPGTRGRYAVATLSYGSGKDRQRVAYGSGAALHTHSVDGSAFVQGWKDGGGLAGWFSRARTRYWGFNATAMPIQGRVWYPLRNEPSPLVLMVHGNHLMNESSDTGYNYLGELLASHGYIFVSVDENFLNSSVYDIAAELAGFAGVDMGLRKETDARAWLLLEHLRVWKEWNASAGHLFGNKVDMARIALMGHSRGGEAVAVAAAFNRMSAYPDDARVTFNYGFAIRSLVAMSPVDGQYRPADRPTPMTDINYFLLHGSHDGDIQTFLGTRQYQRLTYSDQGNWFKSYLYIYRANHGMFSQSWGNRDTWGLNGRLLNVKPLLQPAEQQAIAEVYISAFLAATLDGEEGYRQLFQDYRSAAAWLPNTQYLQQYAESGDLSVSTFDEDIDPRTTTLSGGTISAAGLSTWREQRLRLKSDDADTNAVYLGWTKPANGNAPYYRITLTPGAAQLSENSVLLLSMADAQENTLREPVERPLDLTMEVSDANGNSAALALSGFGNIEPQFAATVRRWGLLRSLGHSELVLQRLQLPLSEFHRQNPDFDPSRISSITLVFDRSPKGMIVLDDVGVRNTARH